MPSGCTFGFLTGVQPYLRTVDLHKTFSFPNFNSIVLFSYIYPKVLSNPNSQILGPPWNKQICRNSKQILINDCMELQDYFLEGFHGNVKIMVEACSQINIVLGLTTLCKIEMSQHLILRLLFQEELEILISCLLTVIQTSDAEGYQKKLKRLKPPIKLYSFRNLSTSIIEFPCPII